MKAVAQKQYIRTGSLLHRSSEEHLYGAYAKPQLYWAELPIRLREWLICQFILNEYVTAAINGETDLSQGIGVRNICYRFFMPFARYWLAPKTAFDIMSTVKGETAAGKLVLSLQKKHINYLDIMEALHAAEPILKSPPAGTNFARRTIHVDCRTPCATVRNVFRKSLDLDSEAVSIYLHGSYADGERTAFSDIDDLVVVHAAAWRNAKTFETVIKSLERVSRAFQLNDPLQHHGHIMLLGYDLNLLDQGLIHSRVLQDSTCLLGDRPLTYNVWEDHRGLRNNVLTLAQELRANGLLLANNAIQSFGLKQLVSAISLLPALVMQCHGIEVDKASAITQARRYFSPNAAWALDWASGVRKHWNLIANGHHHMAMKNIFPYLPFRRRPLETLSKRYSDHIDVSIVCKDISHVIASIFRLSDDCVDMSHCNVLHDQPQ